MSTYTGLDMKKIVLSVMAVVPSRGDRGVAVRSVSDGVLEPLTPAAGAAGDMTLATDVTARAYRYGIQPDSDASFHTAESACLVEATRVTVH